MLELPVSTGHDATSKMDFPPSKLAATAESSPLQTILSSCMAPVTLIPLELGRLLRSLHLEQQFSCVGV